MTFFLIEIFVENIIGKSTKLIIHLKKIEFPSKRTYFMLNFKGSLHFKF